MRLHFASDHGAVALRRDLVEAARGDGHEIASELGPDDPSSSVDYPEIARQLCERVLADAGALGVLCCGTGQGVAMAANRIAGIRAAVLSDAFSAEMARAHNDANVLCMGGRVIGLGLGRTLLRTFLATPFEGGRHARRVALLEQLSRR